jgi:CHAD domain-containing protein
MEGLLPETAPAPADESGPLPALEFLVGAEDAARLARLPMLSAHRAGRAKKSVVLTVWHDSADKAVSQAGLSLSETRGRWRLEVLHPKVADGWFAGTPAPLVAEGPSPAALLDEISEGARAPIAAFSGHRRDFPLTVEGSPARLSVLEGDLRGVVAQRTLHRLRLDGPPQAMARLAARLAAQIRLDVPRTSLGAEALALASGAPDTQRPRGGPTVEEGSSVAQALSGIVAELAETIHFWAPLIGAAQTEEPVHQMRVALRRLRSALSIFRSAVRDDAAWLDTLAKDLQTLAATLGVARDWDVFLGGLGAEAAQACGDDARLAQMLATAARRRDAAYATLRSTMDGPDWQRLGLALALLPIAKPWDDSTSPEQAERLASPAESYAAGVLDRRLKQLLGVGESLDGVPAEQRHDIRKQAKRLRYTIEFFARLFPEKQVRRYLARLEDLQEDFGTFNDAAVAATLAASLGGGADRAFAAGVVQGFGAAAQLRADRHVARSWSRFYRATPFWD